MELIEIVENRLASNRPADCVNSVFWMDRMDRMDRDSWELTWMARYGCEWRPIEHHRTASNSIVEWNALPIGLNGDHTRWWPTWRLIHFEFGPLFRYTGSRTEAVRTYSNWSYPNRSCCSNWRAPQQCERNMKAKDEVLDAEQKELAHKGRSLRTDHWSTKCLTISLWALPSNRLAYGRQALIQRASERERESPPKVLGQAVRAVCVIVYAMGNCVCCNTHWPSVNEPEFR